MVKALNETGLRVVMDVVYNHTNAVRPGREVGARPDRARATTTGCNADGAVETSHLLPEHGHRARDDGEAHGRLGRDLGDASTRSTASAST